MNRQKLHRTTRSALLCGLGLAVGLSLAGCDEKPGIGTAPKIRVSPPSVAFPSVAIGEEETQTITITNIGGGALTVTSVELGAGSSNAFVVEPPSLPMRLTTNQSRTFDVTYRPQDPGAATGRVVIKSDDGVTPTVNVPLSTLDIGPRITIDPDPIDFGVVQRGDTKTMTATIKNEGFADLVIDNWTLQASSDYAVTSPALPLTLQPGQSKPLTMTYKPTGCAPDIEILEIFSNDANHNPYQLGLKGQPPGPAIGAEPTAASFGAVDIGQSVTKTITIKSIGTAELRISSIFMGAGSDPGYSIQSPPTTPATLAANQTMTITVAYRAMQAGFARGALVVSSDDCDKPQFQIPLDAIGTEGPAALVQVSPARLNFGNVASGVPSERTITVTSIGQLPLQVSSIDMEMGSAPAFTVPQAGGFQLGACTQTPCPQRDVTVRFAPTATGAATGAAIVRSNAANEPNARVALEGNGTAGATCSMRVTPGTLNFGDVAVNTVKDLSVTMQNIGTGNCAYENALVLGLPLIAPFRVQSQPARGTIIAPGQSRQITVRLAPTQVNELILAFMTVTWTDPNPNGQQGAANITLTGRSVEARIAVIPARVDVGVVTVGCASPVTNVRVYNAGSAPLTLNSVRLENSPSRYRIIQAPSPGTVLGGNGNPQYVDVKLQYVPNRVGTDTDTLIVESTDVARPITRVPLTGQGTNIVDAVDRFVQATEPKVDILFMIDNSGSMSDEQSNLRNNFRTLAQYAQAARVNYQIGVITTDTGKLQGNPKIIRSTDPDPIAAFGRNANRGSDGDGTERGLEMVYQALTDPLLSNDNAGFLRTDASLEIIALSDEQDQSPANLDFYVTFYLSIKGARNTNLFRFSAIVGDAPQGCNSNSGQAEAGTRYIEVAQRTNGVVGSICDSSFANTLQNIGNLAFGLRTQFFLSRQPDLTQPFGVRSYASEAACDADTAFTGGTLLPNNASTGYTYDAASNSIIFTSTTTPPRGSCIKVKYKAACIAP